MPFAAAVAIGASLVAEAVVAELVLAAVIEAGIAATISQFVISYAITSVVGGALGGGGDRGGGGDTGSGGSAAAADPVLTSRDRTVTVRQPVAPWQIIYGQAKVGGVITYIYAAGPKLEMVITLAGHTCEEIGDIYFGDDLVPLDGSGNATGTFAGYATVTKSLGTEVGQPFPGLVAATSGEWMDSDRQTGRTKIWVSLTANRDVFISGIPNISAVVKGRKIIDPRYSPSEYVYSNNSALCANDYLTNSDFGFGADAETDVNQVQLIAAADACDESITLADATSEARYRTNGTSNTDAQPKRVLGLLLGAMMGKAVNVGGQWYIFAGVYEAPTITLDEGDLVGSIKIQTLLSRRDNCNGAKGLFTDPNSSWQPTSFPAIASADYMAEDGGERVWHDLDLAAYVTSGTQAQRLAKIDLLSTRQGLSIVATFRLAAWAAMTGRTVALTNVKFGWTAKAFEVMASRFTAADDGTLAIELTLRETAAAVYDWSTSEEQSVDIAPNTNLPNPFVVMVPGTPYVSEDLYQTTGSAGVKNRAIVNWAASADAFVVGYEAQYRPQGASSWLSLAPISLLAAEIDDLAAGYYEFRVRAINSLVVRSAWSATTTAELFGLTAAPSNPTNFAVQAYSGQAKFTWSKPTQSSDLDVLIGGRAYVRWSPKVSGASWDYGSLVNPDGYPGDTSIGFGPMMTGTYMLKFCDSSGNYSVTEASFVATEALITGMSTIASVTESTAFTGTKSNVAAVDGGIQLDGTTLIDSMATLMDSWGSIDGLGGISATGSYAFASKLDLTTSQAARLFVNIDSLAFDTDDLIDSRTNNIDDWGLMDGAVIEDVEAQLMVRTTTGDPNASPTWGPWHALGLVADYTMRGFDFRLDFASGNATHNRSVTTLSVTAKH